MWLQMGYVVPMAKTPKKRPAKVLKDDVVRMRVTASRSEPLKRADTAGLELSAWLRQLALRAAGALPEP